MNADNDLVALINNGSQNLRVGDLPRQSATAIRSLWNQGQEFQPCTLRLRESSHTHPDAHTLLRAVARLPHDLWIISLSSHVGYNRLWKQLSTHLAVEILQKGLRTSPGQRVIRVSEHSIMPTSSQSKGNSSRNNKRAKSWSCPEEFRHDSRWEKTSEVCSLWKEALRWTTQKTIITFPVPKTKQKTAIFSSYHTPALCFQQQCVTIKYAKQASDYEEPNTKGKNEWN